MAKSTLKSVARKGKAPSITTKGKGKYPADVEPKDAVAPTTTYAGAAVEHMVVINETSMEQLELYRKLYKEAEEEGKSFIIFATPKLRWLLSELAKKPHANWLNDKAVVVLKYPNSQMMANNVARGLYRIHAVFLAEHGRYHEIIAQSVNVIRSKAIFVSNANVVKTSKANKPAEQKPCSTAAPDLETAIKAFKEKYGTTASKEQIDAFIKEMTTSFNNYLNESLWDAGVYGQSEKHVEVYKGPMPNLKG